jgi:undecaprenyl-phosphate 4-deoxy-4-formamido-L-arabinose transferase
MDVSIVVPVFNSEGSLAQLVERLEAVFSVISTEYELILVNDGSLDLSWQVVQELASRHGWVTGIDLMKNYGQHNALLCGIRMARYPVIVTIDDDLQHPPEEIPKLLAKLDEGFDVVYGKPENERHGLWRDLASLVTKFTLKNAMGARTAQSVSAFRAFRTSLRPSFENYRGAFVSIDCLLTWGTSHFTAVVVRHEPRTIGASNYTFRKLLTHSLNMMTGFSTLPLQIATYVGFAFTLLGVLVLAYVVGRFLWSGGSVPGFAFLASTIAIFSGAQLFALGIIGEYLARMYVRTSEQPAYVVRETRANAPLPEAAP